MNKFTKEQLIKDIRGRIPTQTKTEESVLKSWNMENVNWLNSLTKKELLEIEKTLSALENEVAKHIQVRGSGEIWNWVGYKSNNTNFWDDFDNQVRKYHEALYNDQRWFDYLDNQYEIIFKFSENYAKFNEKDLIELKKEYNSFVNSGRDYRLFHNFPKLNRLLRSGLDTKYLPFLGKHSNKTSEPLEEIYNEYLNLQKKRLARIKKEKIMNIIANKMISYKEQDLIKTR